jgi:serine phosphatase RsbU (regulator of sigma subunit)
MLRRLWHNYVTSDLGDDLEDAYLSKIMFVNTFSIIGNFSLLTFSILSFLSGKPFYAATELVFFLIGLANLMLLRRTGNAKLASSVILSFMIGILVFLFVTGGTQETGFLWYFTYPLLAFFLKERKEGGLWVAGLAWATVIAALLQQLGILPPPAYSAAQTALLLVSLSAVSLLAISYSNIRAKLEEVRAARAVEQYQRRLLEDQLDIARSFQQVLLPKEDIDIPGAEVASSYRTAQKVGGDYFDYMMIDENRIAVILCDVSGHGIASAMGMVNIRSIFRTLLLGEFDSPSSTMRKANNILTKEFRDDQFATLSFYIYDQSTHDLHYCNAGLPHAVHFSDESGTIREIESIALPLGVVADNDQYVDKTVSLGKGDLFIAYTDGIVEAMNSSRDEFGRSRLLAAISRNSDKSPQAVNDAIVQDIDDFTVDWQVNDDRSIITLKAR